MPAVHAMPAMHTMHTMHTIHACMHGLVRWPNDYVIWIHVDFVDCYLGWWTHFDIHAAKRILTPPHPRENPPPQV